MAERDEALLARVRAMEQAIGEIGTTLDETNTCRELAGFLVRRLGGSATVDLFTEPGTPARRAATARTATEPHRPGPGSEAPTRDAPGGPDSVAPAARAPETPGSSEAPGSEAPGSEAPGSEAPGSEAPSPEAPGSDTPVRTLTAELAVGRDEKPLGTVTVTRTGGASFTDHEAAILHHAARLAARHIRHARRLAVTEDTALHLQRALVAEPGRPHPNLEIAGGYLPAGHHTLVGGDWFETVRLHFGRTLLVVGDVMGHGLDAAVDMNAYRTVLREVAATDLPPHRVLRHLDSVVAGDDARRPATCLLVRVDPARGTATFASAGHLPPAVFGADGSAELVDLPVGPPLGTGVGGYEPVTRPLTPAETLLLFTDGLVERRGEDIDVSLARLAALRLPPDPGPEQVVDEVLHRLGAHQAEDDVAVLAARVRARQTT
ncbi:SpoIIE family protein phosphatase [Streptomyces sp. NPDC006482]|uniref:PP2C family protein-serine/threonine phosphatase n=1 Tax=Streptomyces sp. NPDC006482 TaxID=3154306 RepID=UPI0033BBDA42